VPAQNKKRKLNDALGLPIVPGPIAKRLKSNPPILMASTSDRKLKKTDSQDTKVAKKGSKEEEKKE
jgi:hypothetical protein